jgi:glycosyltransferase involved in cell wall biosynthesis
MPVSIALATYNGEKYLPFQLESIAGQTLLPAELIVSDDGSTDRTMEIVREFAASAPFPVRILQPGDNRLGFRDNFMRATQLCSADLIAFCDQDDIWDREKLAIVTRAFDDRDVLLAYHNALLINAANKRVSHLYHGTPRGRRYPPLSRHPWLVVPGFLQVFRRELLDFSVLHANSRDVYWPDATLPHDRWFFLLASVLGTVVYINKPLAHYRQHTGNVFGAYFDRRARFDQIFGAERFIRAASETAKNRIETFKQVEASAWTEIEPRARKGVEYYEGLQRLLESRAAIYSSPSYPARMRALFALLRDGGYSRSRGSARFTGWDLLMDVYLAATLGPRLRRLLPDERQ